VIKKIYFYLERERERERERETEREREFDEVYNFTCKKLIKKFIRN
jgi:hypothetical protein